LILDDFARVLLVDTTDEAKAKELEAKFAP
jgi:hypothetical protein